MHDISASVQTEASRRPGGPRRPRPPSRRMKSQHRIPAPATPGEGRETPADELAISSRYEIAGILGEGGQATVYEARDRVEHLVVALKVLRFEGGTSHDLDAMRKEFQILSDFAHPSIARVRDFGLLDDGAGAFFSADFISGQDLLSWIASASGEPEEIPRVVRDLLGQALGALHSIHRAGFSHGDIKPANIMISARRPDEQGWALKLIDLGGAGLIEHSQNGAVGETRWSTPAYRAPDSLQGDRVAEDLFALGLTFFHALAGRLPFDITDSDAADRWRESGASARLSQFVNDIPARLDELIARLTSVSAGKFSTARDALRFLGGTRRDALQVRAQLQGRRGRRLRGRDAELESLMASVTSASGNSRTLLLAPPGYGKSLLVEHFVARAQLAGWHTVVARSGADAQAWGALLSLVGPDGAQVVVRQRTPGDRATALLASLHAQRVVLVLEDWERDRASETPESKALQKIAETAGTTGSESGEVRVLVTATRPEAFAGSNSETVHHEPVLELRALSSEAVTAMVADTLETDQFPDELVEFLVQSTSGRPDRVVEALGSLLEARLSLDDLGFLELPEDWRQRVTRGAESDRSHRAPSIDGRAVLQALMCLEGVAVSASEAERVFAESDVPRSRVEWERALQELSWSGHLAVHRSEKGECYEVDVPVDEPPTVEIQSAITRRVMHLIETGAFSVEERGPSGLAALARVALGAGDARRAITWTRLAARSLRRQGRHREAVEILEDALASRVSNRISINDRDVSLLASRHTTLCLALGEFERGLQVLEDAGVTGVHHLESRGQFLEQLGRVPDAMEVYRTITVDPAAARPERSKLPVHDAVWYRAQARLAHLEFKHGDRARGESTLEVGNELLDWATAQGNEEAGSVAPSWVGYARALAHFGTQHSVYGQVATAVTFLNASIALAGKMGRPDVEEGSLGELAILHAGRGQFDAAESAFLRCQAFAENRGDRLTELKILTNRASLRYRAGRVEDAEQLYREARVVSDALGTNPCAPVILLGLEVIAHDRGDLLVALRLLRSLLRLEHTLELSSRVRAYYNLGEIYQRLGAARKALGARQKALVLGQERRNDRDRSLGACGVAALSWAIGDLDGTEQHLERAEKHASATESTDGHVLGRIEYFRARVALDRSVSENDQLAAYRRFRRAARVSRHHRNWAYYELALLGMIEALLRTGQRARARRFTRFVERLFGVAGGTSHVPHRPIYPGLLEVYGLVVHENHELAESVLERIRERLGDGHAWEALLSAAAASRHLDDVSVARSCRLFGEELVGRFVRGLPSVTAAAAIEVHLGVSPGDTADVGALTDSTIGEREIQSGDMESAGETLARVLFEWSNLRVDSIEDEIGVRVELEKLRRALGVEGVWILNDPDVRAAPAQAAAGCADATVPAFSRQRAVLEACRRDGAPRWGDTWCLVPMSADLDAQPSMAPRVFHATWADGMKPPASDLLAAAGACAFLLRVLAQHEELREQKKRVDDQAREMRGLHAQLAREKSQLDTAVLSQRQELVQLRRGLGESGKDVDATRDLPVAESAAMKEILRQMRLLANTRVPVLLTGESGVGKDFLARLLHGLSDRAALPLLTQVCEIPETLLESELFGAVRGAFTGADEDRAGLLTVCDGGSLYLDHIEDLPSGIQGRVLRFLEDGEVRPLGSEAPVPVDVRVISSTCLAPDELLEREEFRSDLLYRLQGTILHIPPLRERREDIPALFRQLLARHCEELEMPVPPVDAEVEQALQRNAWAGNVRELDATVRRLLIDRPRRLTPETLGPVAEASPGSDVAASDTAESSPDRDTAEDTGTHTADDAAVPSLQDARHALEADLLDQALRQCRGNATEAARVLGVSRRHLGTLLTRHDLNPMDFRRGD